jgi:hypothetical protein
MHIIKKIMHVIKDYVGGILSLNAIACIFFAFSSKITGGTTVCCLILSLLFAFLAYLCFKKPKHKNIPSGTNVPTSKYTAHPAQPKLKRVSKQTIADYVRIVNDCEHLVSSTKNPETFFSRYNLLCEKLQLLSFFDSKYNDAYKHYTYEKEKYVDKFINGVFDEYFIKLMNLKTKKAILNNCEKYKLIFQPYMSEMTQSNIDNLEEYYHTLLANFATDNHTLTQAVDNSVDIISEGNPIVTANTTAAISQFNMPNNPDICELLWIADGPMKNYDLGNPVDFGFNINNTRFSASVLSGEEPSLIYTTMPISEPLYKDSIPKPPYYPTYSGLSPEQKWMYLQFLNNPFDASNDIGYVFIYYYGLERYLLTSKSAKAFDMIMQLRSAYDNNSFLNYSESTLACYCLGKRDLSLANRLLLSLDSMHKHMDIVLFLALKYSCRIDLSAEDIMKYHKSFRFTNERYIKNEPKMFLAYLRENIKSKYSSGGIDLGRYFSDIIIMNLRSENIPVFANITIKNRTANIPNLLSYAPFTADVISLLNKTHENVKAALAMQRKKQQTSM